MRYIMICSNPECGFLKSNPQKHGIEPSCPDCGQSLWWKCPHCDQPFLNKGAQYCSLCGEKILPAAQKDTAPQN